MPSRLWLLSLFLMGPLHVFASEIQETKEVYGIPGEDISLICMPSASVQTWSLEDDRDVPLCSFTWYRQDKVLGKGELATCQPKTCQGYVIEQGGRSLSLVNFTKDMEGTYKCHVSFIHCAREPCQAANFTASFDVHSVSVSYRKHTPNDTYPWRRSVVYFGDTQGDLDKRVAGIAHLSQSHRRWPKASTGMQWDQVVDYVWRHTPSGQVLVIMVFVPGKPLDLVCGIDQGLVADGEVSQWTHPKWTFINETGPKLRPSSLFKRRWLLHLDEAATEYLESARVECTPQHTSLKQREEAWTYFYLERRVIEQKTWKPDIQISDGPNQDKHAVIEQQLSICVYFKYEVVTARGFLILRQLIYGCGPGCLKGRRNPKILLLKTILEPTSKVICWNRSHAIESYAGMYEWLFIPFQRPKHGTVSHQMTIKVQRQKVQTKPLIEPKSNEWFGTEWIASIVLLVILLFAAVIFVVVKRLRRKKKEVEVGIIQGSFAKELYLQFRVDGQIPCENVVINDDYVVLTDEWEISRKRVRIGSSLGEGFFGQVYQADFNGMPIAVKKLKDGATETDLEAFLCELAMHRILGENPHPNIVQFVGCITKGLPMYIITEYAPLGDLLTYMRENWHIHQVSEPRLPCSVRSMLNVLLQIAKGMEHLASKGIIHRDLAARNVLVRGDCTLAVSDFGLMRRKNLGDYYRMHKLAPLPLRWLAPESIVNLQFTTKTDVWSFGITAWEVFTRGEKPYSSIDSSHLPDFLAMGHREDRPPMMPDGMYSLLQSIWEEDPAKRPDFKELVVELSVLIKMKQFPIHGITQDV